MNEVPELEHHCGSWIISRKSDGKSVLETFSREIAEKINTEKYTIETALQYLCRINRKIRGA